MKKTALLTCLLFINSLNASDANPCPTLIAQVIATIGIMFVVTRLPVLDEPRASLFVHGPSGYEIAHNLCNPVIPELEQFATSACPNSNIDIVIYPHIRENPYRRDHQSSTGFCAIPDLGIMERIESTCESEEQRAKKLFSGTCPVETAEKNDARIKLRKKIIALQKKRSGK
jgi:hypothetical protein